MSANFPVFIPYFSHYPAEQHSTSASHYYPAPTVVYYPPTPQYPRGFHAHLYPPSYEYPDGCIVPFSENAEWQNKPASPQESQKIQSVRKTDRRAKVRFDDVTQGIDPLTNPSFAYGSPEVLKKDLRDDELDKTDIIAPLVQRALPKSDNPEIDSRTSSPLVDLQQMEKYAQLIMKQHNDSNL